MKKSLALLVVAFIANLPLAAEEVRFDSVTNPDAVVKSLEEIRDGFLQNQTIAANYRLKGILQPEGDDFQLIRQGERARFDLEFKQAQRNSLWHRVVTDGKTVARLNSQSLEIYPVSLRGASWNSLCEGLSQFTTVSDVESGQDVAEVCDSLRLLVAGKGKFRRMGESIRSGKLTLTIESRHEAGAKGTRHISITQADSPGYGLELTVDADQGFQLVHWKSTQSQSDPNEWRRIETIENEYQLLSSGGWVLSKGRFSVLETGRLAEREMRPRSWSKDVSVTIAEVLTAEVSSNEFSISSLPVRAGIEVRDHRYVSPHRFTLSDKLLSDDNFQDLIADLEFVADR